MITEIKLKLYGQPASIKSASCVFENISDAVQTVILAIQSGIQLARVELLDEVQMQGMNNFNKDLSFPEKPHLFIEFHGSELSTSRLRTSNLLVMNLGHMISSGLQKRKIGIGFGKLAMMLIGRANHFGHRLHL